MYISHTHTHTHDRHARARGQRYLGIYITHTHTHTHTHQHTHTQVTQTHTNTHTHTHIPWRWSRTQAEEGSVYPGRCDEFLFLPTSQCSRIFLGALFLYSLQTTSIVKKKYRNNKICNNTWGEVPLDGGERLGLCMNCRSGGGVLHKKNTRKI